MLGRAALKVVEVTNTGGSACSEFPPKVAHDGRTNGCINQSNTVFSFLDEQSQKTTYARPLTDVGEDHNALQQNILKGKKSCRLLLFYANLNRVLSGVVDDHGLDSNRYK